MSTLDVPHDQNKAVPSLYIVRLDATGSVLRRCESDPASWKCVAPAGESFACLLAPASRAFWDLTLWPALVGGGAVDEAALSLHFPGSVRDVSATRLLTFWRAEKHEGIAHFVGMLVPGARQYRLLADLRRAQESLEAMPGAVLQVSTESGGPTFPYASGRLLELVGVTCHQAMADPAHLLEALDLESQRIFCDALKLAEHNASRSWSATVSSLRFKHKRIEISAQRPMTTGSWHCVLIDVTEREHLQLELSTRAATDELTQLPNRRALVQHLQQRLDQSRPFAVLFMDCDRFKLINDSLGHHVGDELLKQVAQRLKHQAWQGERLAHESTPCGSMAARLGGDEFLLVIDDIRCGADVALAATSLVAAMCHPYTVGARELVLTVSIGVVLSHASSQVAELLRDSDTAMYEAKRRGRSGWVLFEAKMHQQVARAMSLENDLRHALKHGEIRPAYQPIIHIPSGRVVAFEVLARWTHPTRGVVSPVEFIEAAEEGGQIAALGESILRQSCRHFSHWRSQGLAADVRLSVNLSRAQLSDTGLPQRIEQILAEASLPCALLQLEVTESLAMEDHLVQRGLDTLRAFGIRLSLDDFGTGHSSLAALHRLPVQQVKIDRSFIADMESSSYHLAIVTAVLDVSRSLKLEVVAEGVETQAQADILQMLGCSLAQGWHYSKAMEAELVPFYYSDSRFLS